MTAEQEATGDKAATENTPEEGGATPQTISAEDHRRTENAGSTPLPSSEPQTATAEAGEDPSQQLNNEQNAIPTQQEDGSQQQQPPPTERPDDSTTDATGAATVPEGGQPPTVSGYVLGGGEVGGNRHNQNQQNVAPTINQMAIVASAQNKLPIDKVKSIVVRLSRHTESSGQKAGRFYKNDQYVDKDSYSWRNMSLFEDHQCHLWTQDGTVRDSYKK